MIKRVDLVIDTHLKEEAILELVREYLGDLILHKMENLKSDTKEDAVKEMTGL